VCAPGHSQDDAYLAAVARLLPRYLEEIGVLPRQADPPEASELAGYRAYLETLRGLAPSTVTHHLATAAELLRWLSGEPRRGNLAGLTPTDIDAFLQQISPRFGRASLQHTVAHLRGFLRFLAVRDRAPRGLDRHIDTPRVYRQEQLPRALPWESVRALLESIDRTTPLGRRDYAMLLLIATYGLRTSEVVALTLDDIAWRRDELHVPRRKVDGLLLLPLTTDVGAALLDYIRQDRPALPTRVVFLRARPPAGVLKATAITEVFQARARRSGLGIPFHGPHCLRHSLAVRLLREGVSLKAIGDVLGHRGVESTCVYLRLATDDLRDVALSVPGHGAASTQEVRP
jgi:site-specific recombinase XerD